MLIKLVRTPELYALLLCHATFILQTENRPALHFKKYKFPFNYKHDNLF